MARIWILYILNMGASYVDGWPHLKGDKVVLRDNKTEN